jgi:hypothetical protein
MVNSGEIWVNPTKSKQIQAFFERRGGRREQGRNSVRPGELRLRPPCGQRSATVQAALSRFAFSQIQAKHWKMEALGPSR